VSVFIYFISRALPGSLSDRAIIMSVVQTFLLYNDPKLSNIIEELIYYIYFIIYKIRVKGGSEEHWKWGKWNKYI